MKTLFALLCLAAFAMTAFPTATAHTIDPIFPKCETVYDFPDAGERVCIDPNDQDCDVYEWRTTITGTEKHCITESNEDSEASSAGGIPWPGGQTPDVQCMDTYRETYLFGNYWLVQRDSCSAQLWECPEGYDPPAPPCHEAQLLTTSSSASVECYYVYSRTNVGTYSLVRRSSCSVPEVYQCPYEGAPISSCQSILTAAITDSSAEPNCLQMYRETQVGPVTQVSRDSCHSETYLCDSDRSREESDTVDGYLAGQLASPDPEGFAACATESWGIVA